MNKNLMLSLMKKGNIDFGGCTPVAVDSHDQYMATVARGAMDADPFAVPSNGTPAIFTYVLAPKVIEQLLKPRAFKQVSAPYQFGEFADDALYFPTMSISGEVQAYSDKSTKGGSSINFNLVQRDTFRFEDNMEVGTLEQEQMAKGKIDVPSRKRNAVAEVMSIAFNKTGFFGMKGKRIFGLFNDPSLPDVIPSPADGEGGRSEMEFKSVKQIVAMLLSLQSQQADLSEGNITMTDSFAWIIHPTKEAALHQITDQYGKSAIECIRENFKNLEIVLAPECRDAQGIHTMFLIAKKVKGEDTVLDLFTTMLKGFPLIQSSSMISQKFAASTSGAGVVYPFAISRMKGV